MDDIVGLLKSAGVPAGLIAFGAAGLYAADKMRLWDRPNRKSHEEIQYEREQKFTERYLSRLETVECTCADLRKEVAECREDHANCARMNAKLTAWLLELTQEMHRAGLRRKDEVIPPELLALAEKIDAEISGDP